MPPAAEHSTQVRGAPKHDRLEAKLGTVPSHTFANPNPNTGAMKRSTVHVHVVIVPG